MYFDMKTMIDFYDPQTHLINLGCAEMMAGYGIPHAGTSGSGDGWGPDLLAAGASWMNQVTSVMGQVGLAPFVGSTLNSKAYSPAMTVYGNEVIGAARLFAQGFAVDPASIGAEEALQWGLVNRIAQDGDPFETARVLAKQIAANAPLAVGMAKRIVDQGDGLDKHSQMAIERWAQSQLIATEDVVEAASSFFEKRTPDFKGK